MLDDGGSGLAVPGCLARRRGGTAALLRGEAACSSRRALRATGCWLMADGAAEKLRRE